MPNLTTSNDVDTMMASADFAAIRTNLGLTALATTTPGAGVATFLATPSSANLAAAVTDETGSGALVFATSPGFTTAANPVSNDGAALGTTALGWSDLHLATGALINVANGNAVITHSSGIFTVSTGDLRVTTAGTNAASVVTVGGTQTLTNKTLDAPTLTNTTTAATLTVTTGNVTTLVIGGVTITATGTELNYVDGVTSAIQTQLDAKAPLAAPTFTGVATGEVFATNRTLGSDDTYKGFAITGINAGATIAQWDAVYYDFTAGEWLLADANGTGTYPAQGLAVAAGTDGNALTVMTQGFVRNDAWNWSAGAIYLSGTAGGLTQTAPSTGGDKVQPIGWAVTADVAYFHFNQTWLTVA